MEANVNEKNGEHPYGHIGQLISLVAFLIVWAGDSFFIRRTTFLSDYVPVYLRLFILGLTLIMAIYLFRSGHAVAGHEHRYNGVATTAAFRYVRHPLYLASILSYLGLAISTLSIASLALLAGIFIFHNYIASYEEKLLEAEFPEEYKAYKERTGKWAPRMARTR
jgi:protein-S-isoprenylcysteine O-methyltransferase Ste14